MGELLLGKPKGGASSLTVVAAIIISRHLVTGLLREGGSTVFELVSMAKTLIVVC